MSVVNNEAYASDSDDDDYVPSAEESDGGVISSDEEKNKEVDSQSRATKRKSRKQLLPRKRKGGIKLKGEVVSENSEDEDDEEENEAKDSDDDDGAETKKRSGGESKQHVDSLWNEFKDLASSNAANRVSSSKATDSGKKTVEKVYKFAGEEIKVNEVSSSSEVKNSSDDKSVAASSNAKTSANTSQKVIGNSKFPIKKTGGLGSIMGKISGKAQKINTLEKSRLDWNAYKSDEGIDDELSTFNKGKDGYLERQAFLQRSDLRQFELERNLRQTNRSNR